MVIKILNEKLKLNYNHSVFVNKDLLSNTRDIYKDWRLKKIRLLNLDCKNSSFVIIPNYYDYYQYIYIFINSLKKIVILWLMKKTQSIYHSYYKEVRKSETSTHFLLLRKRC